MFKTKTTIILGAGSSYSYGYPLGDELIDRLITQCKAVKHGPEVKLYESLKFYDPISIDSFLMHYRNDSELIRTAKYYIAKTLLDAPHIALFDRGACLQVAGKNSSQDHTNWYRFLWDAIVSGRTPGELSDEGVDLGFDIITFNYDSSLEYFLARNIVSENSMFSPEQQEAFKRNIKNRINHVYGCINNDYLSVNEYLNVSALNNDYFYKPSLSKRADAVCEKIRLINERHDACYDHIQRLISKSTQVVFLGFGFDDVNCGSLVLELMKTLRARPSPPSADGSLIPFVKYTNYGDSERINRKLRSYLYQQVDDKDLRYARRPIGQAVIKSTKKTYQAISEDFSLAEI